MRCRCYKCDLNEDGYCSEASYVCICEDGTCDRMFIRSTGEHTQTKNENLGGTKKMRVIENYENIQPSSGEFAKPGNGGYILEIVNVTDVPYNAQTGKGDYLRIDYDIAVGDFKGYYNAQNERFGGGKWFANVVKSYKEKALGMFKHFTNCVEESNPGFRWNWQEDKLIGCRFGATLQEEEYLNNEGEVRTKLVVKDIKTVKQIMDGDFKVPTTKKLERSNAIPTGYATPNYPDFAAINDEDAQLPF